MFLSFQAYQARRDSPRMPGCLTACLSRTFWKLTPSCRKPSQMDWRGVKTFLSECGSPAPCSMLLVHPHSECLTPAVCRWARVCLCGAQAPHGCRDCWSVCSSSSSVEIGATQWVVPVNDRLVLSEGGAHVNMAMGPWL